MAGSKEKKPKVIKEVTTVYPTGFRIARNQGLAILEFLDDREDSIAVIFSAAMGKTIAKDLTDRLSAFLESSESGESEDEGEVQG